MTATPAAAFPMRAATAAEAAAAVQRPPHPAYTAGKTWKVMRELLDYANSSGDGLISAAVVKEIIFEDIREEELAVPGMAEGAARLFSKTKALDMINDPETVLTWCQHPNRPELMLLAARSTPLKGHTVYWFALPVPDPAD